MLLQQFIIFRNLQEIAEIAASSIETVGVFLLFNRGSSDDSEMCFPPFKRKKRISASFCILSRKNGRQPPAFFRAPGLGFNGTMIGNVTCINSRPLNPELAQ